MHSSKSSIYYTTTYLTNSSGLLPSNDPCNDSFRMGGADDSEYVSSFW